MVTRKAKFPLLPQMGGLYCKLGDHTRHPWKRMPWKGVYNKVLLFERCTGLTIELAKVEKGCKFPEHYHTTVQTQFLVSGQLRLKDGALVHPGTFNVIPAGQLHGPFFAVEESITFKYFASVPVYILPNGSTFIYRQDGTTIAAGKLRFAGLRGENFIS